MGDELLTGLAAGDEAAYRQVYDRYGAALFRTAMRLLGSRHDAEDAVQELFLGAMVRSRHRLRYVADLKAYLFASLRHETARIARRHHGTAAIEDAADDAAHPPDDRDRAEALWALVRRLPAEQREVLALKTQGDLTFRQIGAACGISPNTAASRYRYALEKLRRMMETER
ncbi:MAG: sigma-70 family RNA polymerase sigma factor [Planctomycetes bacterium]|nr:sigma-70 family RNA polymerase sigma factor [Planctomycetota bacterium]